MDAHDNMISYRNIPKNEKEYVLLSRGLQCGGLYTELRDFSHSGICESQNRSYGIQKMVGKPLNMILELQVGPPLIMKDCSLSEFRT